MPHGVLRHKSDLIGSIILDSLVVVRRGLPRWVTLVAQLRPHTFLFVCCSGSTGGVKQFVIVLGPLFLVACPR